MFFSHEHVSFLVLFLSINIFLQIYYHSNFHYSNFKNCPFLYSQTPGTIQDAAPKPRKLSGRSSDALPTTAHKLQGRSLENILVPKESTPNNTTDGSSDAGHKSPKNMLVPKKLTPNKTKRIVKSEMVKPGQQHKETVFTKRVGGQGEFIVAWLTNEVSKTAGFMWPIHRRILKDATPPQEYTRSHWDITYGGLLFQRKSHEGNSMVPNGYKTKLGKEYSQTLTISMPNSDKYCNKDGEIDISTEEQFRDYLVSICCADGNKNPLKHYTNWKPSHSLTKNPFDSLDQCMTDESVDQVLTNYYLPQGQERKQVHQFLLLSEINGIYTRKISDGRFSFYAVHEFGFPSDAIKQETQYENN